MTNYARKQSPVSTTTTKGASTMTKKENIKGFIKDMVITYLITVILFMLLEDGSNQQIVFPLMVLGFGTLLSAGNYQARGNKDKQ